MSWLRQFLFKFQALFTRRKLEREMAEEMRLHLEDRVRRNVEAGMDPDEARFAAQREFGGVDQVKERVREVQRWNWLEQGAQDLKFAERSLRKAPTLSLAIIATLALCLGAATAAFSVVNTLALRALPFRAPEQLVEVYHFYTKLGGQKNTSNIIRYLDLRANARSFEYVSLWNPYVARLGLADGVSRLSGAMATPSFFSALDIRPILGRFFTAENEKLANSRVVVLGESFWRSHYAANPSVLGQTLRIDDAPYTIIGVAPQSLEAVNAQVRFIRPVAWTGESVRNLNWLYNGLTMIARLKPGVTTEQAKAEMMVLAARYVEQNPAMRNFLEQSGFQMGVDQIQLERLKPIKSPLLLLTGGVAFVLLVAIANVANLLLARAMVRQPELAMRLALGASRLRIGRLLVIESFLLTAIAGLCALGLACVAIQSLNRWSLVISPDTMAFTLDGRAWWFAAAIALLVTQSISLLPVISVFRTDLTALIGRATQSVAGSMNLKFWSGLLVTAQVIVAVVLLIGVGLLVQSFLKVLEIAPGFEPNGVVAARIAVPTGQVKDAATARSLESRLQAAMQEIPGTRVVAVGNIPFLGGFSGAPVAFANRPQGDESPPTAFAVSVTPTYAETLRLDVREGRFIDERDAIAGQRGVVVDESFARRFFPNSSPVGERFMVGIGAPGPNTVWYTIVGVARRVPHYGVEDPMEAAFYYESRNGRSTDLNLLIRNQRSSAELLSELRKKLNAIDPGIVLWDAGPLASFMDRTYLNRRAIMLVTASFAGVALLLTVIGVYGMLAYEVSRRTREIGIRTAIGATRRQVSGMIIRQGLNKTAIGIGLGLIAAAMLTRYVTALLYGIKPTDPMAFAVAAGLVFVIAALASYLPARRAARVDPMIALRCE